MKISLITACFNSEATIRTAIDSVLSQKGVDIEYIVVDGGSTDGTVDIMTLLVKTGLCSSKSDARRNVQQGGVTAGDEKITDVAKTFTKMQLAEGMILRRGKKNYNLYNDFRTLPRYLN